MSATAKNRQIIMPAKVLYAGPITSKPIKEGWKIGMNFPDHSWL